MTYANGHINDITFNITSIFIMKHKITFQIKFTQYFEYPLIFLFKQILCSFTHLVFSDMWLISDSFFINQTRLNSNIQKSGITGLALMFVPSPDKSGWIAMFPLRYSGYSGYCLLMMVFYSWTDLLGQLIQTSYLINLQVVVQHEWSCPCRFEILEWERGIGVWVGGGLGESMRDYFLFHSRLC